MNTGVLKAVSCIGSYFFMIKPRTAHKADHMKGQLYAHRGLHNRKAGVPENSMTAFRKAVQAGYGIELDVQLTKDGCVVVFHDASLRRVCNAPGKVCDYTYEELQQFHLLNTNERIPLFEDVLKMVDGRIPLLVEIKSESFNTRVCRETDRLLREYQGPYVVESFHPWVLRWYRMHRREVCRGQLAMNFQRREGKFMPYQILARHLLFNFVGRPDFIAYDIRDRQALSKNVCRNWLGCPSAAWTVKSRKQLESIRKYYDAFIFEGFMAK